MIRVFIERKIRAGMEREYQATMRRLKQRASHRDGYLSGEMLEKTDDPLSSMIISSWECVEAWEIWASSEQRKQAMKQIAPMLETEETVKLYQFTLYQN
jgi:heme-degrading monooxygenase HmoA